MREAKAGRRRAIDEEERGGCFPGRAAIAKDTLRKWRFMPGWRKTWSIAPAV